MHVRVEQEREPNPYHLQRFQPLCQAALPLLSHAYMVP